MDDIDRDLTIRTVLSEAANQGPEGMAAVAAVIKNRSQRGKFGGTSPAEVVTARNQFEPWNDAGKGKANDPLAYSPGSPAYERAAQIVDGVFSGAIKDPTSGATHFYAPAAQAALGRKPPSWAKGQQGLKIGDHMFFSPDGPNGGDLAQGLGNIGQNPNAPLPQIGAAPAAAAGLPAPATPNTAQTNPLMALLAGKSQPQTPQHGFLNQLLFGGQGWQGRLGSAMPNGIIGALMGGGGGASAAPQQQSGMPMQLPGAAAGSSAQPAMQPVQNADAPTPPRRPVDLTQPQMASAAPMGGGATGQGDLMGILRSMFGLG